MGGRSGTFGGSNNAGVTTAQNKTINRLANRTRNLKNEQYRVVDEDGNIVLEKKGGAHEVAATVGEKREHLRGAVTIHNHPEGGTFSDSDLNEFGYGARQIVVASPEGTYKLTNTKYGTSSQSDGWYNMRNAMESQGITRERSFVEINRQAQNNPKVKQAQKALSKTSEQWVRAKDAGKPQATLDKIMARYNQQSEKHKNLLKEARRQAEVQPYHDFYRKNASKYGFKYEFIKG